MNNIFVDMDGVLVNWSKGVAEATGISYPSNQILKPYCFDDFLTRDQIEQAHDSENFWIELDPYPWTRDILNMLDAFCPTWRFLTRGAITPYSFSGKAIWIDNHFPQYNERLIVCRGSKDFACKPGDILIDDHPKNIREWEYIGGKGFLWRELTDDYDFTQQLDMLREFLYQNYE